MSELGAELARKDEADGDRLVMVARFLQPIRVQLAKGMLESAGIECFLEGEHANALYPMALRVRLQVRRADEAAAAMMLMEAEIEES